MSNGLRYIPIPCKMDLYIVKSYSVRRIIVRSDYASWLKELEKTLSDAL